MFKNCCKNNLYKNTQKLKGSLTAILLIFVTFFTILHLHTIQGVMEERTIAVQYSFDCFSFEYFHRVICFFVLNLILTLFGKICGKNDK
jgi:hypothetical protein